MELWFPGRLLTAATLPVGSRFETMNAVSSIPLYAPAPLPPTARCERRSGTPPPRCGIVTRRLTGIRSQQALGDGRRPGKHTPGNDSERKALLKVPETPRLDD